MSPLIKVDFADNLPDNVPRSLGLRLSIELIPLTTAGINLRSELTPKQWDALRRAVYSRAGYCCEACDADSIEVHCHEVWNWDDKKHVQKLIGLRCLCWKCHEATHLSETGIRGPLNTLKHFARVNGITLFKANRIVKRAYKQVMERSKHEWELDTSWLNSYLQKEACHNEA